MYDQNSFLQGIAVGKSLKGWSSGKGSATPTCWNDEGVYTYFYIDYHLPITSVSPSLFRLSTRVLCENGEIEVINVESIDSTTFKVYGDISKAGSGWIAVIGYNSSWLKYDSGIAVPEYSSVFWIDGRQPWTPGYLEDSDSLSSVLLNISESFDETYHSTSSYTANDRCAIQTPAISISESLKVTYS